MKFMIKHDEIYDEKYDASMKWYDATMKFNEMYDEKHDEIYDEEHDESTTLR